MFYYIYIYIYIDIFNRTQYIIEWGVSCVLESMWKESVVEKLSCCKKETSTVHRRRLANIGILDLLNKKQHH